MANEYKFNAKDFYRILDTQNKRCRLTGRELTPENTNAEHILPLRKGGSHEFKNVCLIVEPLSKLKRYYTEDEIIQLAADIISFRGSKFGYRLSKTKKTMRPVFQLGWRKRFQIIRIRNFSFSLKNRIYHLSGPLGQNVLLAPSKTFIRIYPEGNPFRAYT